MQGMRCPHCNTQARPDAIYCDKCSGLLGDGSSPAGLRCPHCGYEKNKIGEKLCFACSMSLVPSMRDYSKPEPTRPKVLIPMPAPVSIGLYILGALFVVMAWISMLPIGASWIGFGLTAIGAGSYVPRQKEWVGNLGVIIWALGFVTIIAFWAGDTDFEVAQYGMVITLVGGAFRFIPTKV